MIRKYIGFILLSFLILTSTVDAKELPIITIGSSSGYKGEKITIPITLENNSGFNYLGAKIRYDSTRLEYIHSSLNAFDIATMKGIEINSYKTITLYALTATNDVTIDDNGVVAEMQFQILDDDVDLLPIEITVDNFGKGEHDDIDIQTVNGTVQVLKHGLVGKQENLSKELEENLPKETDSSSITWKSSNEEVATVDEQGKVSFHKEGNALIEAVDENGDTVYQKEYKVNDEKTEEEEKEEQKKGQNQWIVLGIVLAILIAFLSFFFLRKRKKK